MVNGLRAAVDTVVSMPSTSTNASEVNALNANNFGIDTVSSLVRSFEEKKNSFRTIGEKFSKSNSKKNTGDECDKYYNNTKIEKG